MSTPRAADGSCSTTSGPLVTHIPAKSLSTRVPCHTSIADPRNPGIASGAAQEVYYEHLPSDVFASPSPAIAEAARILRPGGRIVIDTATYPVDKAVADLTAAGFDRISVEAMQEKLKQNYRKLLESTSRVVGQAKQFSKEIADGVKQSKDPLKQLALDGLRLQIDTMVPRLKQVMKQTRARIFRGDTRSEGKIFSVFEPSTEIIRKGKAGKPNEFGKVVKIQEAESQIVIDYEVYDHRPNDSDLLVPAIETHQAALGRTPHLVAADAAFYSNNNEKTAKAKGVKRVCVPNRSTKSAERKREQKKRWFREGQKWRTGCEGRISVEKRRHGLNRSRYKGDDGMKRWVGFGVIADNVINIGAAMAKRSAEAKQAARSKHTAQ
jgi:IS5 family transposase